MPLRLTAVFGFALLTVGLTTQPSAGQNDLVLTYARVRASIAFVLTAKGRSEIAGGTAFCIFSDKEHSVFVTSRHVVQGSSTIGLVLQSQKRELTHARVLRVGPVADVALLDVKKGGLPSLSLSTGPPPDGTAIAIAGYPRLQIDFAKRGLGFTPSVHAGTVNAVLSRGTVIVFDAQTEDGNSGGPLFDVVTGLVYGIVTEKFQGRQNNLAISAAIIRAIARNAHVATNSGDSV